jgi:hypothetical protein
MAPQSLLALVGMRRREFERAARIHHLTKARRRPRLRIRRSPPRWRADTPKSPSPEAA